MATESKKSDKRVKSAQIPLRAPPEVKAFLEAAAEQELQRLAADRPGAKLGLYNFVIGAAMKEAEKVLGKTLDEWLNDRSRAAVLKSVKAGKLGR